MAQDFSGEQFQTQSDSLKMQVAPDTTVIDLSEDSQIPPDLLNTQTILDTITKHTRMDFTIDAFCNVLGVTNHNAPSFSDPNNLLLYYSLTFINCLNIKEKIMLNTYFYNELGYRIYFDSISLIMDDRYDFNNSLLLPFGYKNLSISLSADINSQFWKHYDYRINDEGETERFLYTSARSPSYTVYSGGINYSFWEQANINLGIASAKKTKIKNQSLFNERESEDLYGIEKGKKRIITFGFNLTLQIPQQKILKNLYFENFTGMFMQAEAYQALKHTTVDIKNAFHYVFFSYFRLSLKTDLKYDMEAFGTKPYIVNQLMLGVYFNNKQ
jgi:hypothetical protein